MPPLSISTSDEQKSAKTLRGSFLQPDRVQHAKILGPYIHRHHENVPVFPSTSGLSKELSFSPASTWSILFAEGIFVVFISKLIRLFLFSISVAVFALAIEPLDRIKAYLFQIKVHE